MNNTINADKIGETQFRRSFMSKCHDIDWEDYKLSIRPLGWRNIFRFWPYFSGSDVIFKTVLRTKSKNERDFTFQQIVNRFDGKNMTWNVVPSYDYRNQPKNTLEYVFKAYLVTTGEYTIQAALYDNVKGEGTNWEVLANFSILERDKYIPYVFFSFLSLFLGAGLTLLVKWIISELTSQSLP